MSTLRANVFPRQDNKARLIRCKNVIGTRFQWFECWRSGSVFLLVGALSLFRTGGKMTGIEGGLSLCCSSNEPSTQKWQTLMLAFTDAQQITSLDSLLGLDKNASKKHKSNRIEPPDMTGVYHFYHSHFCKVEESIQKYVGNSKSKYGNLRKEKNRTSI